MASIRPEWPLGSLFFAIGLFVVLPVKATPVLYSYTWTATNIQDSNGAPPPVNPTTLSGFFSILLDTSVVHFLPVDAPVSNASVFTTDSGAILGPAHTSYTVAADTGTTRLISVGGLVSGADTLIGLSDDYRVRFKVDWTGGLPTPTGIFVYPPFSYTNSVSDDTPTGGAYVGDLQISLQAVPIPAAAPLFGSAIGLFGYLGWRNKKLLSSVAT